MELYYSVLYVALIFTVWKKKNTERLSKEFIKANAYKNVIKVWS